MHKIKKNKLVNGTQTGDFILVVSMYQNFSFHGAWHHERKAGQNMTDSLIMYSVFYYSNHVYRTWSYMHDHPQDIMQTGFVANSITITNFNLI